MISPGGAGLAIGYLADPTRSRDRFVLDPTSGERLYRTGDLAFWRLDGELEIVGRMDTQVKLAGFRIECGEIEIALERHTAVAKAVVVAVGQRESLRLVGWVGHATGCDNLPSELELQQSPPACSKTISELEGESRHFANLVEAQSGLTMHR